MHRIEAVSRPYLEHRPTVLGDLRQVVAELLSSRDLLAQLTLRDIRVRYKQAVLGFAWALLVPMTVVLAGFAVRVAMSYVSHHALNAGQLAGTAVKAVPWAFFVGSISAATSSLTGNVTLVTKIYFPREVLPLSTVLGQTFDSSIGAGALAITLAFLGVGLSLNILWVLPLILLLWIFTAAMALSLSCANLFFRDIKYLVQVFVSFGIFFTPVLIDADMFGPHWAPIIMLNPLAPLLEGLRLSVVEHENLLAPLRGNAGYVVWHPWYLAYSAAWALLGCILSALWFHRAERRFAELI